MMLNALETMLTAIGLSSTDITLMWLCALFSAIGSLVHLFMSDSLVQRIANTTESIDTIIADGRLVHPRDWLPRFLMFIRLLFARIFIGGVLGVILSLYFVGALTDNPNTHARFLAFAILLGYAAPRVWRIQEEAVNQAVEDRIKQEIEKHMQRNRTWDNAKTEQ